MWGPKGGLIGGFTVRFHGGADRFRFFSNNSDQTTAARGHGQLRESRRTNPESTVQTDNPDLIFNVGDTIDFVVNASGHPFYLKTIAGTGIRNIVTGLNNNGTTNQTISWTPTSSATFYYQCSLHGGMVGTITIQ